MPPTASRALPPDIVEATDPDLGSVAEMRTRREQRLRRRRLRRRVVAGVLGAWCLLVLWSGLAGLRAVRDAQGHVQAWREAPTWDDRSHALAEADRSLQSARSHLGRPWLSPLLLVPGVGVQVDATRQLANASGDAVSAANGAWTALSERQVDARDVQVLVDVGQELDVLHSELSDLEVPQARWLLPPMAAARDELIEELRSTERELGEYAGLLQGIGSLLTGDEPLLIAASNSAEMGVGGGMTLAFATATYNEALGIQISPFVGVREMPRPSGVQRDPDVVARYRNLEPGYSWQYSLSSTPRVPENLRMMVDMWNATSDTDVAGVLLIDSVSLAELVATAGATEVGDGANAIPTDQLLDWLLVGQYEQYGDDIVARQAAYGEVAAAAMDALSANPADPTTFAEMLRSLIAGRHLQAYASDAGVQAQLTRASMTGELGDRSLMMGLSNLGGNKLDAHIDMAVAIITAPTGGGVEVRGRIDLFNRATGEEPGYVLGSGYHPGRYNALLMLNVPAFVHDVTTSGPTALYAAGPDGPASHNLSHEVDLDPGESATYEFSFVVPDGVSSLVWEPSGRSPALQRTFNGVRLPDERSTVALHPEATP